MPVLVNIRHLEEKAIQLKGKLAAEELHLDAEDVLVHARLPLRYDLTVEQVGPNILARGTVEMSLDCECARCLKPFKYRLKLTDWLAHLPMEGPEKVVLIGDSVDLTPFLREDILLEFPQHPLCEADCAGLPNRSETKKTEGSKPAPGASAWAELNKLKF